MSGPPRLNSNYIIYYIINYRSRLSLGQHGKDLWESIGVAGISLLVIIGMAPLFCIVLRVFPTPYIRAAQY